MQNSCIDQFDAMNCRAAVAFCDSELSAGMWASGKPDNTYLLWPANKFVQGKNNYDISKVTLAM
jgi:hypothetical protein